MIIDYERKAYKIEEKIYHCGTAVTFSLIGGKWKPIILWYLRHGKLRFSEIKKLIPDMTDKMLSIQLSKLEEDQLLERHQKGKKPPYRVEYSLTDLGKTLIPILKDITQWGKAYAERNGKLIDL